MALFGGLALVAVAVAIFGFLLLRQQSGSMVSQTSPSVAVVDKTALNPSISTLKIGSTAPNFVVKDASGRPTSLIAQRGHPVLLEFFAVWCPHCHREAPVMRQVTTEFAPKGLRTLAVLANPYGPDYEASQGRDVALASPTDLRWYAHTYRANYPLLIDHSFHAVNRYGAGSYPTIYIIDAAGKIAFAHQGALSHTVLSAKVTRLLRKA